MVFNNIYFTVDFLRVAFIQLSAIPCSKNLQPCS